MKTYEQWLRRFLRFHLMRHPREMGSAEVNAFLSDLAVELKVSASTQNQALAALLFLYRDVLESDLELEGLVRARTRRRLPVVLTPEKDRRMLLPNRLGDQLKQHLRKVRDIHQADLAAGYGRVELPHALARKYPNAPVEWGWQWATPCWRAASIKPPRRILSVTPSLPICWSVDRTSARSRS